MKVAEYATLPHKWPHRIASAVVLGLSHWTIFVEGPAMAMTRSGATQAAIQFIATGVIWFSDDGYHDPFLKKIVSYRTVAWIALLGIFPGVWFAFRLLDLSLK